MSNPSLFLWVHITPIGIIALREQALPFPDRQYLNLLKSPCSIHDFYHHYPTKEVSELQNILHGYFIKGWIFNQKEPFLKETSSFHTIEAPQGSSINEHHYLFQMLQDFKEKVYVLPPIHTAPEVRSMATEHPDVDASKLPSSPIDASYPEETAEPLNSSSGTKHRKTIIEIQQEKLKNINITDNHCIKEVSDRMRNISKKYRSDI